MKRIAFLVLVGGLAACAMPSWGQCHGYFPVYAHHHSHRDSCAVVEPFQPSRFSGFFGLLGARDNRGTAYVGGDIEASYFLTPRWSSGLRGTLTGRMPASLPTASYGENVRPLLEMYTASWSNSLLLYDQARWRVAVLAGAGVGWMNLRDKNQQVPIRSSNSCGCTESKRLDTAWSPITEIGLSATYKPKTADGPWLTVRGQYRQWLDGTAFGTADQFSHYLLSVGISLPDKPSK